MIRSFFIIVILSVFYSCSNSQKEIDIKNTVKNDSLSSQNKDCGSYLTAAKKADSVLLVAKSINKSDAEKALIAFNNFVTYCNNDTLNPVFLFKGGQIAQSIGLYTQSQSMFNKCIDNFPNFNNRGAALFLLANLYDDSGMLNNEQEAKTLYNKIIKEYPKTDWARDAATALNNLGKTDEQLVKEFLKKNQTN